MASFARVAVNRSKAGFTYCIVPAASCQDDRLRTPVRQGKEAVPFFLGRHTVGDVAADDDDLFGLPTGIRG